jgi:hypothetical protein
LKVKAESTLHKIGVEQALSKVAKSCTCDSGTLMPWFRWEFIYHNGWAKGERFG